MCDNDKFIHQLYKEINWYYNQKTTNISIENSKIIISSKKDNVNYYSLFEKNLKFRRIPKEKNQFRIIDGSLITIYGEKTKNLKVTFYIIEYSNKKKIKMNRIFLNKESKIEIDPSTMYFRFVIRTEGFGELNINNVVIKREDSILDDKNSIVKYPKDIKIACIFDEFSMASFSDTSTLIPFTPQDWKQVLLTNRPDLLMVESAWQGNFGSWRYEIASFNINNNYEKLKEVILFCNKENIPTVFWNKEDPIHFEAFIGAASLFDYVFTTDENMIEKYKERLNHDNVYALQFGVNPKIHNPILFNKVKKEKISFAGSFYGNRHEERRKDMYQMLKIAKNFGLDIYDRNYEVNKKGKTDFSFPEEFEENIVGNLKYNEIEKAYKDYKVVLNVNSVKNSPTMFSRRVFEAIACGTIVVSSYSIGIKKTFDDIVIISEDEEELKQNIKELFTNTKLYRNIAMKGIREVFRHHTYSHRLEYVLSKINIPYLKEKHSLTTLFNIENDEEFYSALEIINSQSLKNIHILLIVPEKSDFENVFENNSNENVKVVKMNKALQYNSIRDLISTDYITVLSVNHEYGKYYLEDLMQAAIYSEADIVGKKSLFDGEDYNYNKYEYEYVDCIIKDTAVYRNEILDKINIDSLLFDELLIQRLFAEYGARIFSADQFNFKL